MRIPLAGLSTGQSQVKIETAGYSGNSCQAATAALEAALGTRVAEELTDEYYKQGDEHQSISGGN